MKKLIFILLFSISGFSQETEFTFTKEGFTDFTVIKCEEKTQQELYKKTIDWINTVYNTPKEVIKGQIENDYIRIEGSSKDILPYSSAPTRYQIEISFKDGKYKFDVLNVSYYTPGYQYIPGRWDEIYINDTSSYYKKSGEIRNSYKDLSIALPDYFNRLNNNLYKFITTDIVAKKNEW